MEKTLMRRGFHVGASRKRGIVAQSGDHMDIQGVKRSVTWQRIRKGRLWSHVGQKNARGALSIDRGRRDSQKLDG